MILQHQANENHNPRHYVESIVNQVLCHGLIHVQTGHCIFYVVVHIRLRGEYVKP